MNQRKIYSYFLLRNLLYTICILATFLLVYVGLTVTLGKGGDHNRYNMLIIMVFIYSTCAKDTIFTKCSAFFASRQLIFRIQLMVDVLIATVCGVFFTVLDMIWNGGDIASGVRCGFTCFVLIACLQAILSLDGFRKILLFDGLFNKKESAHPWRGFFAYMGIIIAFSILFSAIEEGTLQIRIVLYVATLVGSACCYAGARWISTKKEF